jgi:hypothetical protein
MSMIVPINEMTVFEPDRTFTGDKKAEIFKKGTKLLVLMTGFN